MWCGWGLGPSVAFWFGIFPRLAACGLVPCSRALIQPLSGCTECSSAGGWCMVLEPPVVWQRYAVAVCTSPRSSAAGFVSDAAPCRQHVMVRPSIRIGVDLAAVGGGLAWAVRSSDGTGGGRVGSPLARVGICTASLPMPATVCSKCLPRLWAGLRERGSTICARSNIPFVALLCA